MNIYLPLFYAHLYSFPLVTACIHRVVPEEAPAFLAHQDEVPTFLAYQDVQTYDIDAIADALCVYNIYLISDCRFIFRTVQLGIIF